MGGGFGGITLARRLERLLPPEWQITLLNRDNHITYYPLLAEVVGASILPGHVVAPLRQMVKKAQIRMVDVQHIDFDQQRIDYVDDAPGFIHYDHLVLAFGVSANVQFAPGTARHALPLKTLGDALYLRNRVMSRLEQAVLQADAHQRAWLTTFVIVGGGFSGVEVAGELSDFLRASLRYYPEIDARECKVILVHSRDRLLPEMSPASGRLALEKMQAAGLEFHLNARVAKLDERGILLTSGERIDGGTVITTVGTAPNPLLETLPLPLTHGRIETKPNMAVSGYANVWAIGDCAAIFNGYDNQLSPQTAQFATRQAKQLAKNIVAKLRNRPTVPFHYRPVGQLASIGRNKAIAELYGFRLSGFIGWLLWRGVYLLKIPTLARKVRVFLEWNWEMLFPPDIAYLRFTRSRGVENGDRQRNGR